MSERDGQPRVGRSAVLGGRQAAADWGGRAGDLFSAVFEWLAARLGEEADAARLAPWLAVCFGIGILLYFAAPPEPVPTVIRIRAKVDAMRRDLNERIRAALPGESGAIATALVTGMRDAIPAEANEAMRVSGLAHVLAISGLHMVLVVGTLFAAVRGGLALVPGFALRRPVKKWAAVIALLGALGYLVLSGAAVSTQRAFVMIAAVLLGVLADRPALTLRTLSLAAVVLLALTPEAILHRSFQMSFAATLALVALFERFAPYLARPPAAGSSAIARATERLGRWLVLGAATSLAAGLATALFAAFHFHRVAPYGLISNVLAMPVLSFAIMPAGLVSVLLVPFGYDALGWQVMGKGIELMLSVARWVNELPGAEGRVSAFGAGAVLIATAGLLVLAIPASRLRYGGIPLILFGLLWAAHTPRPDILVDAENRTVAVRGVDGRLSILDARKNRFTAEMWLAADGDGRKAGDDLGSAFRCDNLGCAARLPDGTIVAVARQREAFADDCREAGLMVTQHDAPEFCRAAVIDRRTLATTGAIALRRVDGKWIAEPARSPLATRPWFGRARAADPQALLRLDSGPVSAAGADASIDDDGDEQGPGQDDAVDD
jgi:competence protein ComEC